MIRKILVATVASIALIPAISMAQVGFQAGDIANDGTKFENLLDHRGSFASYYKDGKSGTISFLCTVEGDGDNSIVNVTTGKNFDDKNNKGGEVKIGEPKVFTWTLYDRGENNGNIRVWPLSYKNKLAVNCHQLA